MPRAPTPHVGTALAIALALSSPLARAGNGSSSPQAAKRDTTKKDAQALFGEGNQLFGEGEYLGALEKFRAAYAIFPSPKILLNEATTMRVLGRNIEAIETYEKYLSDPEKDPAKIEPVRRAVREIDAFLAHVDLRPSVTDASVAVDGKPVATDKQLRFDPGEHAIIAQRQGFSQIAINVKLMPGENRVIPLTLLRPNERAADPGALQRTIGWVTAGVGAASLAASIVFVVVESSKAKQAASLCQPSTAFQGKEACSAAGSATYDQAASWRAAANWTSIGGALALAGGVGLVLLAPKKPAQGVTMTAGLGRVTFVARW